MIEYKGKQEQLNIVITGHVDHGKSTVIGRLLADTKSLPEGKLQMVQDYCKKNSKTFEYAFLLDALKEEQSQGITIDAARIFFKTDKRSYIILDAPGHIEFLRNMITGASKAEAALIVIDANEGIQENSTRHGYLVSMIGIKQVSVIINKMDLVDYSEEVFNKVKADYGAFLKKIGVQAVSFIPVMAQKGDNIASSSDNMKWYSGPTVIEQIDSFKQLDSTADKTFRFSIQDVYKFTQQGDDRRILAGRINSGTLSVGETVFFSPSNKSSRVKSIEFFNSAPAQSVSAGFNCGVTIDDPLYIKPGEIMWKKDDNAPPLVNWKFKGSIFWMGNTPMFSGKQYVAKLGTAKILVKIAKILNIIDASELSSVAAKDVIDKYDVAECIFESAKPIAFDKSTEFDASGRFVVIDNFEISGAGIIIDEAEGGSRSIEGHIADRKTNWDFGYVTPHQRELKNGHKSKFVLITGEPEIGKREIAKALEKDLFERNYSSYYVGNTSIIAGLDNDLENSLEDREEKIRRMGELARILTDSGFIFISTISDVDEYDLEKLKLLNEPNEILVVNIGKKLYDKYKPDLNIEETLSTEQSVEHILKVLKKKEIVPEYYL